MGIKQDFEKVGHIFKVIAEDVKAGLVKLFGLQNVENLLSSVEALLKTDVGQNLLQVGEEVAAGLAAGTSPGTLIVAVAEKIAPVLEAEGVALGEAVYHLIASMIVSKLQSTAASVTPPTS